MGWSAASAAMTCRARWVRRICQDDSAKSHQLDRVDQAEHLEARVTPMNNCASCMGCPSVRSRKVSSWPRLTNTSSRVWLIDFSVEFPNLILQLAALVFAAPCTDLEFINQIAGPAGCSPPGTG